MVLKLIEEGKPLDEVAFYDTGMEFEAIYKVRDMLIPIIKNTGIEYTELRPEENFLYSMLAKPVRSDKKGFHYGYGWCGGLCRWGTTQKTQIIDSHTKGCHVYVGIAADEPKRLERLTENKSAPLAEWGMNEKDCLEYCWSKGVSWGENGVDLYDILDRVSCWCCCNKNRKELKAIWKYLPGYWEKLKALQIRLSERPMKKFSSKEHGIYGNLLELEEVFKQEEMKGQTWNILSL